MPGAFNNGLSLINMRHADEKQRLYKEITKRDKLLRDLYDAWCFECDPWNEEFACSHYNGCECSLKKRIENLGIELD